MNGAADIRRITQRSTVIVDVTHGPGDVALFLGDDLTDEEYDAMTRAHLRGER